MAKENSFEKKSGTGRSTSQAKESPKVITPSWSHFEDDPHDSFDINVSEKTFKNEKISKVKPDTETEKGVSPLDKPAGKVFEARHAAISAAGSFDDLYKAIEEHGGIPSTDGQVLYRRNNIEELVKEIREGKKTVNYITRNSDLRSKVEHLLSQEQTVAKNKKDGDNAASSSEVANTNPVLNKAVENVKEGDISSLKSEKVVYGAVAKRMKNKWQSNFDENIKNKPFVVEDEAKVVESDVPDVDISKFQTNGTATGSLDSKAGSWPVSPELNVAPSENIAPQFSEKKVSAGKPDDTINEKTPEKVEKKPDAKLEQAKEKWRTARDLADKLEAEFALKHEEYVFEQSKRWQTLPRRMLGIQPSLPDDMLVLKNQADTARARFHMAADKLLNLRDNKTAERLNRRLLPKVTAVLPLVYKQREEAQRRALDKAWGESKHLRPTLEFLAKNKYTISGLTIGSAAIASFSVVPAVPILAAIGMGTVFGRGSRDILKQTYVAYSRENLRKARENLGTNYWQKSYSDMSAEMERLTFNVGARETRTKLYSGIVGAVAGIGAGVGTNIYINGLEAGAPGTDVTNSDTTLKTADVLPKGQGEAVSPPIKEMGDLKVMEEMQALSDKSSNIPPKEMGDLRVMEEMQALADKKGHIELADIPNSKLEGVPMELRGNASELPAIPEPKLEGVPAELEMKGSIEHADIPEPKLEGVPPIFKGSTFELPEIPNPKLEGVPDGLVKEYPVEHPDVVEPKMEDVPPVAETVPKSPIIEHTLVKNENTWNVMEGKGPDTAPVGGKSEVVTNMSVADRRYWLDRLFDYAKENPKFGEEAGAIRSGGNLELVYPGEKLNVTMLDDKIRELMAADNASEAPMGEKPDIESPEPVNKVTDMNDISLNEVLALSKGVSVNDPDALARLEELGLDDDSLMDMIGTLKEYGSKPEVDMDMTVREFLNETKPVFRDLTPSETSGIPEATPYGPNDPIPGPGATDIVRDASVTTAETPEQSLNNYVRDIEQPRGGGILDVFDNLFGGGKPNIEGSFEAMQDQDLSVGDIRKMVAEGSVPAGMKDEGFDTWVGEMNKVAANDNERFGDVIARVANSRAA